MTKEMVRNKQCNFCYLKYSRFKILLTCNHTYRLVLSTYSVHIHTLIEKDTQHAVANEIIKIKSRKSSY